MTTKNSRITTATPEEYSHLVSNFINVKMRRRKKTLKTTNEEQSVTEDMNTPLMGQSM